MLLLFFFTKNAYTSRAKSEFSQKMSVSPASGEMTGSSTNLLNMRIGVDEEQVDPSEVKKIDENTVTVEAILN